MAKTDRQTNKQNPSQLGTGKNSFTLIKVSIKDLYDIQWSRLILFLETKAGPSDSKTSIQQSTGGHGHSSWAKKRNKLHTD